jgi:ubiquinone/menaquinone biosynthesis C-methylase UbiE
MPVVQPLACKDPLARELHKFAKAHSCNEDTTMRWALKIFPNYFAHRPKVEVPTTDKITRLAYDFLPSMILLTAVELELFTVLAKYGPMTNEEIRQALDLHPRALPDFTDSLLAFALLERDGSGPTAKYKNTPETALFLDKNRPGSYIGGCLERCAALYQIWAEHPKMMKDKQAGHERLHQVQRAFDVEAKARIVRERHYGTATAAEACLKPHRIFEIGFSFWLSRMVLTACEIDLFTLLEAAPKNRMSGAEIAKSLDVGVVSAVELLDTLVTSGMMQRDGAASDKKSIYYNSPDCALYLDRNKKTTYMGGLPEFFAKFYFTPSGRLHESLRTGCSQGPCKYDPHLRLYDVFYKDPVLIEYFSSAMMGLGQGVAADLSKCVSLKKYKTLTDIGGGTGQLASAFAKANPRLQCTVTELPEMVPIGEQYVKDLWPETQNRVRFLASDFNKEKFPKSDVICFSVLTLDFDDDVRRMLIKKAYKALNKGGLLIITDAIIDEDRRYNAFAISLSLLMLIAHGAEAGGRACTSKELEDWCKSSGFHSTEVHGVNGQPMTYILAHK